MRLHYIFESFCPGIMRFGWCTDQRESFQRGFSITGQVFATLRTQYRAYFNPFSLEKATICSVLCSGSRHVLSAL